MSNRDSLNFKLLMCGSSTPSFDGRRMFQNSHPFCRNDLSGGKSRKSDGWRRWWTWCCGMVARRMRWLDILVKCDRHRAAIVHGAEQVKRSGFRNPHYCQHCRPNLIPRFSHQCERSIPRRSVIRVKRPASSVALPVPLSRNTSLTAIACLEFSRTAGLPMFSPGVSAERGGFSGDKQISVIKRIPTLRLRVFDSVIFEKSA